MASTLNAMLRCLEDLVDLARILSEEDTRLSEGLNASIWEDLDRITRYLTDLPTVPDSYSP
jgi:hypothetical protein